MPFLETPRFPDDIAYGSSGGPMYNTIVIQLKSGVESHNVNWSYPQHRYDVAYGVRTMDNLYSLLEMFHACAGRGYGFRFKDFTDCKSSGHYQTTVGATDQLLGTGNATLKVFQIIKTYEVGSLSRERAILKPVSGTVRVSIDDVEVEDDDATYPWSVDTTTGVITFTGSPPPDGDDVKAGYEFDVPCWFETDELSTQLTAYQQGEINVPIVEDKYPS